MDELTMLSFVGIYFLLAGTFIYNFYLSKRIYKLLANVGEIIALASDTPAPAMGIKETGEGGTMKKLLKEGMELEQKEEP